MLIAKRALILGAVVLTVAAAAVGTRLRAATVKVADPTTVVMIVNRDSNEIAFMDIKTKKIVGKTFLGNNGAHWVGVVDVRRHELLKKIQIAEVPGVARLDPAKYLGEIKGINIAMITNDGRYLYAADGDLGVVGKIDPREDKIVKVIRVGQNPWRIYMSHDGKYAITPNNGDQTISIIDLQTDKVAATLEAGPDMTGVNFAGGKAFVIRSTSGFVYVYNMSTLKPAGRMTD